MRLLLRKDYGGLFAQGSGSASGSTLIVRSIYLGRALGAVVGTAALVGTVYAYRRLRWFFWFAALAFLFTGFGFLVTTNLNPSIGTSLFVMERFFLLPQVVVAPLTGLGVAWLGHIIAARRPTFSLSRATAGVASLVVVCSLIVVGANYSTLDVSNDRVTGNYATDVLTGLNPHTILFATGDEADITTLYMSTVGGVRPDVTVLVSPLLAAPWYVQLLRHDHQLKVPAEVTTLTIIRANPRRPVAFIGDPPDKSIDGKYYLAADGLVYDLEPEATNISLTQNEADNVAQLARVHVPTLGEIKPDSFEGVILSQYAAIPADIGLAYSQAGQKAATLSWYHRALAIDPNEPTVVKYIRKLGGTP
jgi:hypothetical protein